jgi:hypothetical protein
MVTVPAFVWRGGFLSRVLITGAAAGLVLGLLAWVDSGFPVAGACVLVAVGIPYGIWMARRMSRFWPAVGLDGTERVAVVRAARHGLRISDSRLSAATIDYVRGMHATAHEGRPWRWLLIVVLVVGLLSAVWDTLFGSVGNAVASALYLMLLVAEVWWWPKRQAQLLAKADSACGRPVG